MVGAILTWTSAACGDDLLPIGLQKQLGVGGRLRHLRNAKRYPITGKGNKTRRRA